MTAVCKGYLFYRNTKLCSHNMNTDIKHHTSLSNL